MKLANITKYAAIGAVAGIAAYASYSHMRDLALEHHQTLIVASLLPVSVDGMLIVATLVMREDRQAGLKVRPWAWVAFILGVGASVVANVLAAADDVTSRVISAWPAVALLLVIEVLATGKKAAVVAAVLDAPAEPVVQPAAVVTEEPAPAEPTPPRKAAAVVAALRAEHPDMPQDAVAKQTGLAVRTVQRHWNAVATA